MGNRGCLIIAVMSSLAACGIPRDLGPVPTDAKAAEPDASEGASEDNSDAAASDSGASADGGSGDSSHSGTGKTSWIWLGTTGMYPWGCSAAAGCGRDEASTVEGDSFYADIQAHPSAFTHVSISLYTLNLCDSTCTCPDPGTCATGTHGLAYQSGVPWLASCDTHNSTEMCNQNGPDNYDGDQATRARLAATYHGLGLKVSALVNAGVDSAGTDKGAAAVLCGGSTASGQSPVDPTLTTVCPAQRSFIQAMVSEAQTYGYDDINLDWELGEAFSGSDADLGAEPTYPKISAAYGQAFSNFLTNFKSALRAAGLETTLSVDAIPGNVNGSYCSGASHGGFIDPQILAGPGGALTNGSLDYVILVTSTSDLFMDDDGAAAEYPPASCGASPTWANNFYGSAVLDSGDVAGCDESLVGYALMMCPPNWGSTLAIDESRVVIGLEAGQYATNPIAGKAMQVVHDFGYRGVAFWPDFDGPAVSASFMSTRDIDTSGFSLGGSDWYQMLENWRAAP